MIFISGFIVGMIGFVAGMGTRAAVRREPVVNQGGPARIVAAPSDPIPNAMTLLQRSSGGLRQMAEVGRVLRSLDRTQMEELANRLDRLPHGHGMDGLKLVLAAWSRLGPDATTDWIRPILDDHHKLGGFFPLLGSGDLLLVEAWCQGAPEKAIDYVRTNQHSELAEYLLKTSFGQLGDRSGPEKFEILKGIPSEKTRREMMVGLFFDWASANPREALRSAQSLPPGQERDRMVGEVLLSLADKNPSDAFRECGTFSSNDQTLMPLLTAISARKDPAATAKWLETRSNDDIRLCGGQLITQWAETDLLSAFDWAVAHGVPIRDEANAWTNLDQLDDWKEYESALIFTSPLAFAARQRPQALSEWILRLPAGPERDQIVEKAVFYNQSAPELLALGDLTPEARSRVAASKILALGPDVEAQVRFVQQLPHGPERNAGLRAIAYSSRGVELPSLPPGPDRDTLLAEMAWLLGDGSSGDFDREWQLIQQISDPERRRQAFDDLAFNVENRATFSGQRLLLGLLDLPDVPEEWKKPWRGR